jgi:hypothetical protein
MDWKAPLLRMLSEQPCCGYRPRGQLAAEPTALAALALCSHGYENSALAAARWLAELQSDDGSVGVRRNEPSPQWPTSLAMLAWFAMLEHDMSEQSANFEQPLARAVHWALATRSESVPQKEVVAHDTTLVAWPWVAGTHAWVEPTALHVIALKALGYGSHPPIREGVAVLWDRQLADGGWNYGNTVVLGQPLRAHLQPTGLALLALAGEDEHKEGLAKSLQYLAGQLSERTPTASLCWSLLGLAAHGCLPQDAHTWLKSACQRTLQRDRSPLKVALLLLASLGVKTPLIALGRHS